MNINEAIAKNLNAVRKEQGMSIGKLARYTGLSKAAISQIEQGGANLHCAPQLQRIQRQGGIQGRRTGSRFSGRKP